MTIRAVPLNIKIYTTYGTFLAATEHNDYPQKSFDAIKIGSMDNGAYPPLENMTFHGDYAVAHLARSIMRVVRE